MKLINGLVKYYIIVYLLICITYAKENWIPIVVDDIIVMIPSVKSINPVQDQTKYYEVYVEKVLTLNLDFSKSLYSIKRVTFAHGRKYYIDYKKKILYYYPDRGYVGKDEIKLEFYDKTIVKYPVNIIKPPLSKNRDFTISSACEYTMNRINFLDSIYSFDIDIVNNNLDILEKIYDNKEYSFDNNKIPRVSKIIVDNWIANKDKIYYQDSIRHHNAFSNHLNDNIMLTCNYSGGYFSLIYPLIGKNWYAIKPYTYDFTFERNDLYFYVSALSELHRRVYLKIFKETNNVYSSYYQANIFMEKIFPNSHYTAELLHNYDRENNKWLRIYSYDFSTLDDKYSYDNKIFNDELKFLSDELTKGDIIKLLQKVADNYESYYLSGHNQCLDKTICGALFPEYTTSVTLNAKFKKGLSYWIERNSLISPAVGKIKLFSHENLVDIEYSANRYNGSNDSLSSLELYQTEYLYDSNIDDYFLRFDLKEIYGGAGGNPVISGTSSSGFTGVYTCYKDKYNNDIGCMVWSDHTNKFDLAFGTYHHRIESSAAFYNFRLRNVFRRIRPSAKEFLLTINIGEQMKKYLPTVYNQKNKIKSIEYGLYATEFRNPEGGCYFCKVKIKADEVNLLKVVK